MSDRNQSDEQENEKPRPSQAEGARNPGDDQEGTLRQPSQAEGDRETVEQDLEQQG